MPISGNKKRLTKRHWLKLPINNIKVQPTTVTYKNSPTQTKDQKRMTPDIIEDIKVQPTTVIYENPLTHKQKIKSV